jgi:hypothetical protein
VSPPVLGAPWASSSALKQMLASGDGEGANPVGDVGEDADPAGGGGERRRQRQTKAAGEEREDRRAFFLPPLFPSAVGGRIFCIVEVANVRGAKQLMPLSFCIVLLDSALVLLFWRRKMSTSSFMEDGLHHL